MRILGGEISVEDRNREQQLDEVPKSNIFDDSLEIDTE
jgi:hypothetical protein